MLEWKVKIGNEFFELGQPFKMFFGKDIRIEVKDSIMKITWELIQRFQKFKKSGFTIEIDSISRTILSDQNQFSRPLRDQCFCLFYKCLNTQ